MPANLNPPPIFPTAWASAWGEDAYGYWQAFEINGIQQVMRWMPQGEFEMGSPSNEADREDDEEQHSVIISQDFWLADTTCTQALWFAVMRDNPSDFKDSEQNPVESISWNDCKDFIQKSNQLLGEPLLRLPTEEEWEYSCRAGTQTPFNTGENITTAQANYDGNYTYKDFDEGIYLNKTVSVLEFSPNPWGLFQMHGNVWEWCDDIYDPDYKAREEATDASQRVLRGGGWIDDASGLRSAARNAYSPDDRNRVIGLRLAGGLGPTSKQEILRVLKYTPFFKPFLAKKSKNT